MKKAKRPQRAFCDSIVMPGAGVRQPYHGPLFSPHKFIRRRLLEKLNPWPHHLGRYVETFL